MNRTVALLMLLLAATGPLLAADPVVVGQSHKIESTVLKEQRSYSVYLPASYGWAVDRRYPVLYVLDGKSHFLHTAGSAGYLASYGEIPEMIVVALDSTVRVRDFTQTDWEAWNGGGGADNFKKFLSTELIPTIERTYRADGFRILSGHSAGGQFVLYCLTAEPTLFRAYFALSPSLDWDGNLPQKQLQKFLKETRSVRAFLYIARSDDAGRALADYDRLVYTLETNTPQGFRWFSQPFPFEMHTTLPLVAQTDALRRLYARYRLHNDSLERGIAFAQQHFEDASNTVGWPLPIPESVINSFGYAALSQKENEEAIAMFKRNVEANPNSANAYDSLADGYAAASRWHDAATALERAVALAVRFNHPNRSYFEEQLKKMKGRMQ